MKTTIAWFTMPAMEKRIMDNPVLNIGAGLWYLQVEVWSGSLPMEEEMDQLNISVENSQSTSEPSNF